MEHVLHGISFAANSPEDCVVLMHGKLHHRVQSIDLQIDAINFVPVAKMGVTAYGGGTCDSDPIYSLEKLKADYKFVFCYLKDNLSQDFQKYHPLIFWNGEALSRVQSLHFHAEAAFATSLKVEIQTLDSKTPLVIKDVPWIKVYCPGMKDVFPTPKLDLLDSVETTQ
jgi:hypothetical protein